MPLTGTATPSSGDTPTSFSAVASGGMPAYSLTVRPSPPNPTSMPDITITPDPLVPGKWSVTIEDEVPADVELLFSIQDSNADSVGVSFTSTG